jgi:hypothetical protein
MFVILTLHLTAYGLKDPFFKMTEYVLNGLAKYIFFAVLSWGSSCFYQLEAVSLIMALKQ